MPFTGAVLDTKSREEIVILSSWHSLQLPASSADVGRDGTPRGWKARFKINVKVRAGAQVGQPYLKKIHRTLLLMDFMTCNGAMNLLDVSSPLTN